MRSVAVPILKFSELSEKAKQRAKEDSAALFGYRWSEEAIDILGKLAQHFDGRLKNYDIDFFGGSYSSAEFEMPDEMSKAEIRRRLKGLGTFNRRTLHGHGDCKLTGMCLDEDAIDGFRIAFIRGKETDLEKLMDAAFQSLFKACREDCDDEYTDERFSEHCDANEYEFHEDGSFYRKKR